MRWIATGSENMMSAAIRLARANQSHSCCDGVVGTSPVCGDCGGDDMCGPGGEARVGR
jgi:hypothetical protein